MNSNIKQKLRKSNRDRTLINLPKSSANMASGISTLILSENPEKLCDRLKLLIQQKQAGIKCYLINKEIVAIVNKLLENKCMSKKQHKQIFIKSNLLRKKRYVYMFFFTS